MGTSLQVVQLNQFTHKKLLGNKATRKCVGGDNEHFIQCQTVANVVDVQVNGVHRKCYQKFSKVF